MIWTSQLWGQYEVIQEVVQPLTSYAVNPVASAGVSIHIRSILCLQATFSPQFHVMIFVY